MILKKKIADATWDFSNFLTTGQNAGLSFAATQAAVRAKKEADAAKAKAEQRQDLISLLEQQQNYVQSVRAAAPIQQDRLTPSMRMLAQYRPSIPTAPVPQFSPTTMILGQKPVFATSTISASAVASTPKALSRMSDADLISLAHKLGIRI